MNRLRWIFGIPLAFAITIGLIVLNSNFEEVIGSNTFYMHIYLYYHAFMNMLCLAMLVFLSALFIPFNRKYAAVIALSISFVLEGTGFYFALTDRGTYGDITFRLLLNYAGAFAGLLAGFYISYEVFKNRSWSKPKTMEEDKAVY
jgi:hypothetical protein